MIKRLTPDFLFQDERGDMMHLKGKTYEQVGIIRSAAGSRRGGHKHRFSTETFYIIDGEVSIYVRSGELEDRQSFHTGELFEIERSVFHSFYFEKDTLMLELHDRCLDLPDGTLDTVRE